MRLYHWAMLTVNLAAAVVAVLLLAGCQTFTWAHHDCRHHGGLDRIGKVGNSYFAVCKDGTWHS